MGKFSVIRYDDIHDTRSVQRLERFFSTNRQIDIVLLCIIDRIDHIICFLFHFFCQKLSLIRYIPLIYSPKSHGGGGVKSIKLNPLNPSCCLHYIYLKLTPLNFIWWWKWGGPKIGWGLSKFSGADVTPPWQNPVHAIACIKILNMHWYVISMKIWICVLNKYVQIQRQSFIVTFSYSLAWHL